MFPTFHPQKLKAHMEAKFTQRGAAQEKSASTPSTSTNVARPASSQEDFTANLAQGRKARRAELVKMTTAPTKRQAAHHAGCAFDKDATLVYCVCVEEEIRASFEEEEEEWDLVEEAYPKAAGGGGSNTL
ncbi:hypothetical protein DL546_004130 [Coniochaeta pulveracea]|uniref:Uncharacterized protein n=1 Tax=Coniochaeta pulveracea TaxID=177199 RepID=A0A420Y1D0_9PEZI|nr:hypothetical protein DL546_004130 [Coniochaeta pulveracea]